MPYRPAARIAAAAGLGMLLAACAPGASPGAATHVAHDPVGDRVRAELAAELSVEWEPAGPHHTLGRAEDGTEIDLIGVPVEEVVLSVPASDPERGLAYLPHVRDLLHGPDRVYDWVAAMLACRADATRGCEDAFEQGNLEARFSDGGPDYEVVTVSRSRG
jgi:hypothetical protein